jgi:hypothetical protein
LPASEQRPLTGCPLGMVGRYLENAPQKEGVRHRKCDSHEPHENPGLRQPFLRRQYKPSHVWVIDITMVTIVLPRFALSEVRNDTHILNGNDLHRQEPHHWSITVLTVAILYQDVTSIEDIN